MSHSRDKLRSFWIQRCSNSHRASPIRCFSSRGLNPGSGLYPYRRDRHDQAAAAGANDRHRLHAFTVTKSPAEPEALRGIPYPEWAWVELNYRPHAYQTETERWPAPTVVDSAEFSSLGRGPALAGAEPVCHHEWHHDTGQGDPVIPEGGVESADPPTGPKSFTISQLKSPSNSLSAATEASVETSCTRRFKCSSSAASCSPVAASRRIQRAFNSALRAVSAARAGHLPLLETLRPWRQDVNLASCDGPN
jgi:hypothetical protein